MLKSIDIVATSILETLDKPSNIDEIAIKLPFLDRQNILESLILLLDSEKVKMLDYKTYYKNF